MARNTVLWSSVAAGCLLVAGGLYSMALRSASAQAGGGRARLAHASTAWQRLRQVPAGARRIEVGLGYCRGRSQTFTTASGTVKLDLVTGGVTADIVGLPSGEFDLWIVDGSTDATLWVGRLERSGDRGHLSRELGPAAFAHLQASLVTVAPADLGPERGLLYGSLPLFQRLYTARSPATGVRLSVVSKQLGRGGHWS